MSAEFYKTIPLTEAFEGWCARFGLDFSSVNDFFTRAEHLDGWTSYVGCWEYAPDEDVFLKLTETAFPVGRVFVISDTSYNKDVGAFDIDCERLEELVAQHRTLFGDRFFDTDLIMLDQSRCSAWIFHHEGVYIYATEERIRAI
jgi:hypothetical protein